MANTSIDIEDLIPAQAFGISALVTLGIVQLTAYSGTINLGETYSVGGLNMSLAFLIQVVAVGVIAWTNEMDLDFLRAWDDSVRGDYGAKYDELSRWAALGMVALLVGVEFIPQVNDLVTSSDALATIVFLIEAAGVWAISWAS